MPIEKCIIQTAEISVYAKTIQEPIKKTINLGNERVMIKEQAIEHVILGDNFPLFEEIMLEL